MSKLGSLQRIRLNGFRSIREMDLMLKPLNVLIGPNGAGKSNFISFFKFMNKLLEKDLQLYVRTQLNGADRTLFFGRKTTDKLSIVLHFPPNSYRAELVPTNDDGLVFASEAAWFHAAEIGYLGGDKRYSLAPPGSLESALPAGTFTVRVFGCAQCFGDPPFSPEFLIGELPITVLAADVPGPLLGLPQLILFSVAVLMLGMWRLR